MYSHVLLPNTPPVECITDILRMIREKTIVTEFPDFVRHVYEIAGYGLYLWLGNKPLIGSQPGEYAATLCDTITELTQEDVAYTVGAIREKVLSVTDEDVKAVPWAVIIPLIFQLISLFRKK